MATTTKKIQKVDASSYTKTGQHVEITSLAKQSGVDHGLIVSWKKVPAHTTSFRCDWEYAAKKNSKGAWVWEPGTILTPSLAAASVGNGMYRNLWTAPNNAKIARCKVTPVSASRNVTVSHTITYDSKGKVKSSTANKENKPYFTASVKVSPTHNFLNDPLPKPSVSVSLRDDGLTFEVVVESSDVDAHYCDVQMGYSNFKAESSKYDQAIGASRRKTFTFKAAAGKKCWFRARVQTTEAEKTASDWRVVEGGATKPTAPTKLTAAATGANSVELKWTAGNGAKTYEVQYVAGSSSYFKSNPGAVRSQNGIIGTAFRPTDLEAGQVWYFRVRSVNDSGASAWTEEAKCLTAAIPEAPTLIEMQSTYEQGELVRLAWVHNAADGSGQSAYQIRCRIVSPNIPERTVLLEGYDWSETPFDTAGLADNTWIEWQVRTKGVHPSWSNWSGCGYFFGGFGSLCDKGLA